MSDNRAGDLQALYRQAFRDFGSVALWNMRPTQKPTPADALAITAALRRHGSMDGRRLAERIETLCRAITKFQSNVLRLLAAQRSPDSYIAGGIAINRSGPRFSEDIDIFPDSADRQTDAVKADEAALAAAGYAIIWPPNQRTAKQHAGIEKDGEQMQLEWVTDSAFRFFPTQPDELFGYVLHPLDLAANKASAADRRVPRDIVDLVTIHESILPLGSIVAASVGKFPGTTGGDAG
jgi:hypothetical protein